MILWLFIFMTCLGGEIGRRTGLKILGFLYRVVPVRFRPEAPFLSLALRTVLALVNHCWFFVLGSASAWGFGVAFTLCGTCARDRNGAPRFFVWGFAGLGKKSVAEFLAAIWRLMLALYKSVRFDMRVGLKTFGFYLMMLSGEIDCLQSEPQYM